MTLKDDIKVALDAAKAAAHKATDYETGLRTTVAALQTQNTALSDRITAMQNQPGPWTDADLAEIKGGIEEITAALNPDTVVATVTANAEPAAVAAAPIKEFPKWVYPNGVGQPGGVIVQNADEEAAAMAKPAPADAPPAAPIKADDVAK